MPHLPYRYWRSSSKRLYHTRQSSLRSLRSRASCPYLRDRVPSYRVNGTFLTCGTIHDRGTRWRWSESLLWEILMRITIFISARYDRITRWITRCREAYRSIFLFGYFSWVAIRVYQKYFWLYLLTDNLPWRTRGKDSLIETKKMRKMKGVKYPKWNTDQSSRALWIPDLLSPWVCKSRKIPQYHLWASAIWKR